MRIAVLSEEPITEFPQEEGFEWTRVGLDPATWSPGKFDCFVVKSPYRKLFIQEVTKRWKSRSDFPAAPYLMVSRRGRVPKDYRDGFDGYVVKLQELVEFAGAISDRKRDYANRNRVDTRPPLEPPPVGENLSCSECGLLLRTTDHEKEGEDYTPFVEERTRGWEIPCPGCHNPLRIYESVTGPIPEWQPLVDEADLGRGV